LLLTDRSQQKWCKLGTKATRALAFETRHLLTYSRLRRQVLYDLARACKQDIERGLPVSEENRAILAAFSSKPQYQASCGTGLGTSGVFMQGPFILLDKDLDVAAQVRDHIAQSVSLHLHVDDRSDDEDEDEDEAGDEAERPVERAHMEQQGEAEQTGEETEIEDDNEDQIEDDEEEEDLDGEYESEDDLSWWEEQNAVNALRSQNA
jgi:hypothetical protein